MIPDLPDVTPAIREIERTLAERREAQAKGRAPAGAVDRIRATERALWWLRLCERMTYFEEN